MQWWRESVVYQIYPKSFQDTNSDGIGDILGIITRLDYLEKLGVEAIWLSPVYQSPNFDNGYDISDYESINPEFGSMEDIELLIDEAKKRDIRILMDLVLNHTRDKHKWFLEAKKGKDNPYRDYYIWRDPINGEEPNDLRAGFGGSAWEHDKKSNQYYFHLFSKQQPDLNWENPQLRQEIWQMMRFWLDKGVAGFRLDVIDLIGKVPNEKITVNGPKLHEYLQEMNQEVLAGRDTLTVGEAWSASPEIAQLYGDPSRNELSMIFSFEHMVLDEQPGKSKWDLKLFTLLELKHAIAKWQVALDGKIWNSLFWNNHDLPRIVSRWGNEKEYRVESAKMFAITLHLLKGTPYIYQGEELGMTNFPISDMSEVNDIETHHMYVERIKKGYSKKDIFHSINAKGRDNARTPMQWSGSKNSGFTDGKPWLHINPNYSDINVEAVLADPNSIFYTYQQLIKLRKENPVIIWGEFKLLLEAHKQIFAYERSYKGETWIVVANMSEIHVTLNLDDRQGEKPVVIGNYPKKTYQLNKLDLGPYETFVVKDNFL
ncbi:alpha-glucosidase [Desemzia sp. RIT804]|uniref:glycoside hydrolase family 13 protein n=1 Tax=Desemzia sp. RIT 804 TaxID=2810209 RepID=UPI001950270D|nr:alpha-glucosidase [Desemzia sp. RIT 804]MBM6615449.1 alpha-glucosidase [Desemzia sp. RIT 804]